MLKQPLNAAVAALLVSGRPALAFDTLLGFNSAPEVETRSMDEIHKAALAEGGVVTLWHGGDEPGQQNALKSSFEAAFPGMTLNVTVDLSKYHDVRLDQKLASAKGNDEVDSIILQTLHDYPRWADEGALLDYAPLGFDQVHPAFKDSVSASWYGIAVFGWNIVANTAKVTASLAEFEDFLRPEWKDRIVLTYPNDDDAVLFAFELIMRRLGTAWFDALLAQNPRWVRGTDTPLTVLSDPNSTWAASFTTGAVPGTQNLSVVIPARTQFVTWPQTGAILRSAPHPEGAKLLHNFLLSNDVQATRGWSVRLDTPAPPAASFPFEPDVMKVNSTNPTAFAAFMQDRARVERLKNWFESRIGTAQGLSPLVDDI